MRSYSIPVPRIEPNTSPNVFPDVAPAAHPGPPWRNQTSRGDPNGRASVEVDATPGRWGVCGAAWVTPSLTDSSRAISTSARGFRWAIRSRLAEWPALYLPLARVKYRRPGPKAVGSGTELVIDGYTRSAVTFAVFAFQLAQDRPVRLAHHLHAPAQLIEAARRGVPALAVIRAPEEAVLSALIREPYVTPRSALVAYSRFYESLLPYRSAMVVGEFEEVTADLGTVIRRVNQHFGTRFREFDHSPENVRFCFDLVEVRARRPAWDRVLGEFECGFIGAEELRRELERHRVDQETPLGTAGVERAARPSAERERMKGALRRRLQQPELRDMRVRADRAYERFLASSEA
jgi:hypothetical protein